MNIIPRAEHPNPQFVRESWINLNGEWEFQRDPGNSGEERNFPALEKYAEKIIVPFCPESELSGINEKDFMSSVFYRRKFTLDKDFVSGRVLLHIGACDWHTKVWVNGAYQGEHIGGYIAFSFDITKSVCEGENTVVIHASDNLRSGFQPAGKQCTDFFSRGCSYTRTTGIWQTVWLEAVPESYIKSTKYITDSKGNVSIEAYTEGTGTVKAEVSFEGAKVLQAEGEVLGGVARLSFKVDEPKLWAPGEPNLYDLKLTFGQDEAVSYFGLRDVEVRDHRFYVNGKSVFGRFILDQGFYPDGIYTARDDSELKADITRSLDCGYNGARLHQKIFEPRFLYHADKLGYMVWGEHANWGLDLARPEAWRGFTAEWLEAIKRDFNHPSLIGWCPLNETQRNQDPELVKFIYNMTKAYDSTRPVIDCSGWVHVKDCCDMYDCHDYEQDPAKFKANYDKLMDGVEGKAVGIFDWMGEYPDELCFVSEFGGTWWSLKDKDGWGYGSSVADESEFLKRYEGLIDALLTNDKICAFCYTQLTDVEQEQNGLYTYDRVPKFDTEVLKRITSKKSVVED